MKLAEPSKDIFTIDSFWSSQKCNEFIARSESIGYKSASINTDLGPRIVDRVRNNKRVLFESHELAQDIWTSLKEFIPERFGNSVPIGLNELFRFYRYEANQEFHKHRDESYIRSELESSFFTFLVYLNENFQGGSTSFDSLEITPKTGRALIFRHDLEHSGNEVVNGIKYVLRTDVMYKLITK